jgi:hypothetical protein
MGHFLSVSSAAGCANTRPPLANNAPGKGAS